MIWLKTREKETGTDISLYTLLYSSQMSCPGFFFSGAKYAVLCLVLSTALSQLLHPY